MLLNFSLESFPVFLSQAPATHIWQNVEDCQQRTSRLCLVYNVISSQLLSLSAEESLSVMSEALGGQWSYQTPPSVP